MKFNVAFCVAFLASAAVRSLPQTATTKGNSGNGVVATRVASHKNVTNAYPRIPLRDKTGALLLIIPSNLRVGGEAGQVQVCRCVMLHQCNREDVANITAEDERGQGCTDEQRCCVTPNEWFVGSSDPMPVITSSTQTTAVDSGFTDSAISPDSMGPPETTATVDYSPPLEACTCTQRIRCTEDITTSTLADRIVCPIASEICCRNDRIMSEESPDTDTEAGEDNCSCVSHSQCPDYVNRLIVSQISRRAVVCAEGEVCCPPISPQEPITYPHEGPTEHPLLNLPILSDERCGIRRRPMAADLNNRVVANSEEARATLFGEFPWMLLILKSATQPNGTHLDNIFVCGATLIQSNVAITAAHCVHNKSVEELKVRAGEYNLRLDGTEEPLPHQQSRIERIVIHPKFHKGALLNDVALLFLSKAFILTDNVNVACLPNPKLATFTEFFTNRCLATGWGKDSFGGGTDSHSGTLRKVDLPLVPNGECQSRLRGTRLGSNFILDKSFICAGGTPGMDTCEGDGGGPLVCELTGEPGRYVHVGIVSWGIGCGDDTPAVYASTLSASAWILEEVPNLSTTGPVSDDRQQITEDNSSIQQLRSGGGDQRKYSPKSKKTTNN